MTDEIEELFIKENDFYESVNGSYDTSLIKFVYNCKYNRGACSTLSYWIKANKLKCFKTFSDWYFVSKVNSNYVLKFRDKISEIWM